MRRFVFLVCIIAFVSSTNALARTWYITPDGTGDAPTIKGGIDSAVAGDTVLVGSGTYLEAGIYMKSGVVLVSETGMPDCVTIDAESKNRVFVCDQCNEMTVIKGFTIANGAAPLPPIRYGGGIWCHMSFLTVSDCVITNNFADSGGGCVFFGGAPTFVRCTFSDNYAGVGGGIACDSSSPQLINCTFYGNFGSPYGGGIHCMEGCSPEIENTIIASSTAGEAISCEDETSTPILTCCDIHDNAGGDWIGPIADQLGQNGNFSECPSFCNAGFANWHLCDESPCLPGNHPDGYGCGVIGAWPQGCGCGPTRSQRTSWGAIKALHR